MKDRYIKVLCGVVSRELKELDRSVTTDEDSITALFSMLHDEMVSKLEKEGRRNSSHALTFWRTSNDTNVFISPRPFYLISRAFLCAQASSASTEHLFSDLGRLEGRQRQSLLTSSMEVREIIIIFVLDDINSYSSLHKGFNHPKASAFVRVCNIVSAEVIRMSVST